MTGFDITTATFLQSGDISSAGPFSGSPLWTPDGSKLFIPTLSGTIAEFSTVGFDVSSLVFITTHSGNWAGATFNQDGTKLFYLDSNFLFEDNLTIPFDLTPSNRTNVTFLNVSNNGPFGGDSQMLGMWMSSNGENIFTCGLGVSEVPSGNNRSSDRIYRWKMTTPFDLSTAFLQEHYHVTENKPVGMWGNPDGTKLFMTGQENQATDLERSVWQFTLSPAYDLPPVNIERLDISNQVAIGPTFGEGPFGLTFSTTGGRFFYNDQLNQELDEWTMPVDGIIEEFDINAKIKKIFEPFDVNARIIKQQIIEPTINARLVIFCDGFNDNTGWSITNGGGQILIDDPSFPNVFRLEALTGGGGSTERSARKNIGKNISGDVKLEFKFDFQAMNGSNPSSLFIQFQEQNLHPENVTGSFIGCKLEQTRDDTHHLYGRLSDGTSTVTTIQGGTRNQRTTHVYPPNQPGGVDPELLGIRWVTLELKDDKLRMSLFKDESRTIHARGSPREVNALGINPSNLRYLVISNDKGEPTDNQFTGEIDDLCVTQGDPLPPLAINTSTTTLIEDWDGFIDGEQNPTPWTANSTIETLNGGIASPFSIDIREVSNDIASTGFNSFKLHTLYQHLSSPVSGGTQSMSSVIDKTINTPANPDGGELQIPYKFTARLFAGITSPAIPATIQTSVQSGVFIMYEILGGAPLQNLGDPRKGLAFVAFQGAGSDPTTVKVWNGTSFEILNVASREDNPEGSFITLEKNIKDAFNNDSVFNSIGLDFESHVKSISIGYFIYGAGGGSSSGDVELLLYGDEINLLPEDSKQKLFSINALINEKKIIEYTINAKIILVGMNQITTDVNAVLKKSNQEEFFVNSNLFSTLAVSKTFSVNGRIVFRTAVNNVTPNAILKAINEEKTLELDALLQGATGKVFTTDAILSQGNNEFFFVDAQIQEINNEKTLLIDAIILAGNQITVDIDAMIKSLDQEEVFIVDGKAVNLNLITFEIDAQITPSKSITFEVDGLIEFGEPQSILTVESVIGHKTGLQS